PLAIDGAQLERFLDRARDRRALVAAEPVREQDALDEVQLRERPWLEPAPQIGVEQPLVEERLVELLLQERLDDRGEELGVLLVQEERELVARVLAVELLLLLLRALRPVEHERELREVVAARDRQQQPEHARERVVDLDLR